MTKTLELGPAVNRPKPRLSDRFFCSIGIHTYYGLYCHYDSTKQGHPFEGYYDVCLCGYARKREGDGPFPTGLHRSMVRADGTLSEHVRKWRL